MSIEDDLRDIAASLAERVLLCVHQGESATNSGEIANLLSVEHVDVLKARTWLIELGLADEPTNLTGHFDLSARGHQAASILNQRKVSIHMRIQACGSAMLRWLDDSSSGHYPVTNDFLGTHFSEVDGAQFTVDEVHRTASWLHGQGLIAGTPTAQTDYPVRVALSSAGHDCLIRFGGDVDAYLSKGAATAGDLYNVNVSDSSNLQIMQGSAGGSQSWTQQLGAVERQKVSDLAVQILEQVGRLDLPAARIREIEDAAGQIRDARDDGEATPGKIRALVGTVTTAALGAVGTAAGMQVLQLAGQIVDALPG